VEMGGEEEKAVMAPPESAPTFMDAAFAEDQALGSTAERGADERPFFKTDRRQGRGHTRRIKGGRAAPQASANGGNGKPETGKLKTPPQTFPWNFFRQVL
jgi:hypothetical protein